MRVLETRMTSSKGRKMPAEDSNDGWSKLTKIIVGLTGVLVVVPSLINSGKNIYDEINKIPRSDAERVNVEFFKKYWGKKPVGEFPLQISREGANYQVNFTVYGEGDIYIQYGNMAQWFAFPRQGNMATHANHLISAAYADEETFRPIDSEFRQVDQIDSFQGGNAIRETLYENGMRERQVIDIRTGMIINQTIKQTAVPTGLGNSKNLRPIKIDLNSAPPKFDVSP